MLDFKSLKFNDFSPIYLQIVKYVKEQIVLGIVESGEELPSRRLLSASLLINPNTIQKAYKLMEEEGFILSYLGSGSVLSFTMEQKEYFRQELQHYAAQLYISNIKKTGVSCEEAKALLEKYWNYEENVNENE